MSPLIVSVTVLSEKSTPAFIFMFGAFTVASTAASTETTPVSDFIDRAFVAVRLLVAPLLVMLTVASFVRSTPALLVMFPAIAVLVMFSRSAVLVMPPASALLVIPPASASLLMPPTFASLLIFPLAVFSIFKNASRIILPSWALSRRSCAASRASSAACKTSAAGFVGGRFCKALLRSSTLTAKGPISASHFISSHDDIKNSQSNDIGRVGETSKIVLFFFILFKLIV